VYLHVVNTDRTRSAAAELHLSNGAIGTATAYQIVDDPMVEISELNSSKVM
jgi:alpha-L-arabinofuranosidase